jgi:hypothetical protein
MSQPTDIAHYCYLTQRWRGKDQQVQSSVVFIETSIKFLLFGIRSPATVVYKKDSIVSRNEKRDGMHLTPGIKKPDLSLLAFISGRSLKGLEGHWRQMDNFEEGHDGAKAEN